MQNNRAQQRLMVPRSGKQKEGTLDACGRKWVASSSISLSLEPNMLSVPFDAWNMQVPTKPAGDARMVTPRPLAPRSATLLGSERVLVMM